MVVSFGESSEEDVVRGVKFVVEKHDYGRDGEKRKGLKITC